jgi:hypothetical protein
MSKASEAQAERDEYAAELRESLKNVSTIYTVDKGTPAVAQIELYMVRGNRIVRLTYIAAKAMGDKLSKQGALAYGGWGYSKEFQAVYSLGRALYPDGYRCQGKNCHSNDHSNGKPRDGRSKHGDGGYRFLQAAL